jgi:hypothetical protein
MQIILKQIYKLYLREYFATAKPYKFIPSMLIALTAIAGRVF